MCSLNCLSIIYIFFCYASVNEVVLTLFMLTWAVCTAGWHHFVQLLCCGQEGSSFTPTAIGAR